MDLKSWLDTPVTMTRRDLIAAALGILSGSLFSTTMIIRSVEKSANVLNAENKKFMAMQKESIDFLLERAPNEVHQELNEKLDFWRVVYEVPTQEQNGDK